MQFKNISPQGDLDLPLIGRVVARGEVIEVAPHQAELLAKQPDVWQPVTTAKPTTPKPTEDDQKKEPIE
jgi:hypothetical protein